MERINLMPSCSSFSCCVAFITRCLNVPYLFLFNDQPFFNLMTNHAWPGLARGADLEFVANSQRNRTGITNAGIGGTCYKLYIR